MHRVKKFAKWFLAAAMVLVAARTATTVPGHESASPIFCQPLLTDGGGGDCDTSGGYLFGWG